MENVNPFSDMDICAKYPDQVKDVFDLILHSGPPQKTYEEAFQGFIVKDSEKHMFTFDISNNPHHRKFMAELLYGVCEMSYVELGFLITSLVVRKDTLLPSVQFTEKLKELKVMRSNTNVNKFWRQQTKLATEYWYDKNLYL